MISHTLLVVDYFRRQEPSKALLALTLCCCFRLAMRHRPSPNLRESLVMARCLARSGRAVETQTCLHSRETLSFAAYIHVVRVVNLTEREGQKKRKQLVRCVTGRAWMGWLLASSDNRRRGRALFSVVASLIGGLIPPRQE